MVAGFVVRSLLLAFRAVTSDCDPFELLLSVHWFSLQLLPLKLLTVDRALSQKPLIHTLTILCFQLE